MRTHTNIRTQIHTYTHTHASTHPQTHPPIGTHVANVAVARVEPEGIAHLFRSFYPLYPMDFCFGTPDLRFGTPDLRFGMLEVLGMACLMGEARHGMLDGRGRLVGFLRCRHSSLCVLKRTCARSAQRRERPPIPLRLRWHA